MPGLLEFMSSYCTEHSKSEHVIFHLLLLKATFSNTFANFSENWRILSNSEISLRHIIKVSVIISGEEANKFSPSVI